MAEVTLYFHHGGEWLTSPEPHYDKRWVHYWRGDLNTHGVSVKTLVDHIECGIAYDNSLVDYSTIVQYFTDKLQSDPKYKVKEMKVDLHRVFDLNALSNDKRKFLRMYICFKAMKLGSKCRLRPFIGLDGTFLKGKAKGQGLLDAVRTVYLKNIKDIMQDILSQIGSKDGVKRSLRTNFKRSRKLMKRLDMI
ncbi:hypothetical protein KY284_007760 [Solanum tuberosum]|nr:hypothetical protein KY284_007760 [Solanum tuberosum]